MQQASRGSRASFSVAHVCFEYIYGAEKLVSHKQAFLFNKLKQLLSCNHNETRGGRDVP